MLVLAFDTATDVATSALLEDGRVLGERTGTARALLGDVDTLLAGADVGPNDLDALVVGIGPGSFTSTRIGLAYRARPRARTRDTRRGRVHAGRARRLPR